LAPWAQGRLGGLAGGRSHGFDGEDMTVATRKHVLDPTFEDEPAPVHDGDAVAHLFDLAEQMRAKDHGLPFGAHRVDHAADGGRADGVDARGRFVQDDELGVMDDGLGETDALEHALGIGPDRAIGRLGHRRQAESVFDGSRDVRGCDAAELGAVADEFATAEELMEVWRFRQEAGAAAGFRRGRRTTEDFNLPAVAETRPRTIFSVVLLPQPFGPAGHRPGRAESRARRRRRRAA
jgi:hypothetical protein